MDTARAHDLNCFITWRENNIIRVKAKYNAEVKIDDAKENSQVVNELTNGQKLPLLVDITELKSITKEAREWFSNRGRESNIIAIAMLIKSPVSTIIGNFYIGLNKPRVPTKLFHNEGKALKWSQTVLKQYGDN